jgi:hypothetical protein
MSYPSFEQVCRRCVDEFAIARGAMAPIASKEKLVNAASLMGCELSDFHFDLDTEVTPPSEKALLGLFDVAVEEVRAAEVEIFHAIAQHEIGGASMEAATATIAFLGPWRVFSLTNCACK